MMMTLKEAMREMEQKYNRLCRASGTSYRYKIGHEMLDFMEEYPQLNDYWTFNEKEFYWSDRFTHTKRYAESSFNRKVKRELASAIDTFDDGIDYNCCFGKGLYFIGETHFNPITNEKFYWVKIGKSECVYKRMNNYNTCNPMLWRIDFSPNYHLESMYHNLLGKVAIAKCNHNNEWFLVDETTYLAMCEEGFDFFESMM